MARTKRLSRTSDSRPMTLGLATFAKFSAMEGLALTPEQERDIRALDERLASPEERRRKLSAKYGKTRA